MSPDLGPSPEAVIRAEAQRILTALEDLHSHAAGFGNLLVVASTERDGSLRPAAVRVSPRRSAS